MITTQFKDYGNEYCINSFSVLTGIVNCAIRGVCFVGKYSALKVDLLLLLTKIFS
jgi:hypothetical protein